MSHRKPPSGKFVRSYHERGYEKGYNDAIEGEPALTTPVPDALDIFIGDEDILEFEDGYREGYKDGLRDREEQE